MAGFVFGTLVVADNDLGDVAELARPQGTLEDGRFDPSGAWIPDGNPQLVSRGSEQVPGFGIDPQGRAYFDTDRVDVGDAAHLWVEPDTGAIWLEEV